MKYRIERFIFGGYGVLAVVAEGQEAQDAIAFCDTWANAERVAGLLNAEQVTA